MTADISNPKGSIRVNGKLKFPLNTKGRARNAMARHNQAKPRLKPGALKALARGVERRLGTSTAETRQILGK